MSSEHATYFRDKVVEHMPEQDGYAYEMQVYRKGLNYERPPFTFQADKWEELACQNLSAKSKG